MLAMSPFTLQLFSRFYGQPHGFSAILPSMAARAQIRHPLTASPAQRRSTSHGVLLWLVRAWLVREWLFWACFVWALLPGSPALHAQTAAEAPPATPYTLHVYEDLLQLPALVLDRAGRSYGGLDAAQFTLQLDGGPPFHPRHTRLEGNDPLQVVLVFDAGQKETSSLAQTVEQTEPAKLETWLGPADNFSLYALDCHLIRSAYAWPYSAARLQESLARALAAPDLHAHTPGTTCGAERRLWDSLAVVVSQLGQLPGRHLILVVSDGLDDTSRNSWSTLARYAGRFNTTLMGLHTAQPDARSSDLSNRLPLYARPVERLVGNNEDIFPLLCGQTGGIVLPTSARTVLRELNSTIELIHGRYILEFPRPRNGTVGLSQITASVPDRRAVVLAASIAFPPRNPVQDADPDAIPSDPTRAPQLGSRKIPTQPR